MTSALRANNLKSAMIDADTFALVGYRSDRGEATVI